MGSRIFLPARRGQQVLVFEHREQAEKRRWEFVAAAVGEDPAGPLRPTGVVGLKPADMEDCARAAAALPALEAYLETVHLLDLATLPRALELPKDAAVVEGSPLFTLTLYLQFRRNCLVSEASLARYNLRPAAERFEVGLSASIYVSLLKQHDLERASALLDEDLPIAEARNAKGREWGYYFGQAAAIRQRNGNLEGAVVMMQTAAEAAPKSEIFRRVGNLQADLGRRDEAIAAFMRAEKLTPLPAHAALKLGKWLLAEERYEEAERFGRLAKQRGAENAAVVLDKIPQG